MKIVGQTLFLGASVVSFSSNIGWGSSNSSLTVELIEDFQPFGKTPFKKFNQNISADYGDVDYNTENPSPPLPSGHPGPRALGDYFYKIPQYNIPKSDYDDNHYYNCQEDDCYVDEFGLPYNSNKNPKPKEKNVPGKVYYTWINNKFVSKYWYGEDPGFFATGTRINPNGDELRQKNLSDLYVYDIINTPVYFKFDDFEFIGLVKSWERNNRPGGITYSVTIESFNSLLDNCYVILDKYSGAIFANIKTPGEQFYNISVKGNPINSINTSNFNYNGLLQEGCIPNIFNVYGFLESFGLDFFGGSNLNDNGISSFDVLQGLSALTSSHNRTDRDLAYSPFGRILSKTLALDDGTICPNLYNFGIISPNIGTNRFSVTNAPAGKYNAFSLDLSDIDRLVAEYRISGSKNISDLLREISDATGSDYIVRVIPAMVDDSLYQFVIKIISVDRTAYQSPYSIKSIITDLESKNYSISNSSFGQETNGNITHKFIIGGRQQRLLQVKNYRFAYAQTNYVYNPILKSFITLNRPWNKARVPDVTSTRHPIISNLTLGGYLSNRININDTERNLRFSFVDNTWKDLEVSSDNISEDLIKGNYKDSIYFSSPYHSKIITSGNLNKTVDSNNPTKACNESIQLGPDQTLDDFYIDKSCVYYTPQDCPIKPRTSGTCSDEPNLPGGKNWLSDPTADKNHDFTPSGFVPITGYDQPDSRYLNLHNDWICPYFGRTLEQTMPVSDDTNEYRTVRPVFLDIWTNQIVVGFSMHELPLLSIGEPLSLYDQSIFNSGNAFDMVTNGLSRGSVVGSDGRKANNPTVKGNPITQPQGTETESKYWNPLNSDTQRTIVYGKPGFVITESEMRASLNSFDSYFSYCLGKSKYSKPDLFVMLLSAYAAKGELIANFDKYFELSELESGGGLSRAGIGGVNQSNVSFNNFPTIPTNAAMTNTDMNWNMLLNHNFIKDLQIICEFIRNIADIYYGKQYLVKLPDIMMYRDNQYSNISIPASFGTFSVYTGSNKLFYSYEIAEGAWEEPGNYIDDCIVIGDSFSKILTDEKGLIGPIAGFNSSLNIDDVRKKWCELDAKTRIKALFSNSLGTEEENDKTIYGKKLTDLLDNVITLETDLKYIDLTEGPMVPGGSSSGQTPEDYIQSLTYPIIKKFKDSIQAVALKELRIFGTTINCLSSLTKRRIQESWNKMWSSMINIKIEPQSFPTIYSAIDRVKKQWSKIITDTQTNIQNTIDQQALDFSVPSLDISSLVSGDSDFVVVPVSTKKEPYGRASPRSSKLFTKCNSNRNILFMNLTNFTDARVVMTLNNKLTVNDSSLAYSKDPGISVMSNVAIEDSAIYIRLKNRLNTLREKRNEALEEGDNDKAKAILDSINILSKEVNYLRMLKSYIVPEIDPRYLIVTGPSANPSVNHHMMVPRAAHPYFFAVPLKSNQFSYGPWTNYVDNIVPEPYINNLIHKVSVESNDDLVPWNYGSSSALDTAVSYQLNTDINYQTIIENGRVSIIGPPIFGLGGVFNTDPSRIISGSFKFDNSWYKPFYAPYKFFDTKTTGYRELQYDCIKLVHKEVNRIGPLISNINIQVGTEGVTTSYSFQTYNPKTGLYSKNYEEAIKKVNNDRNKLQKSISSIQKQIDSKLASEATKILAAAKTNRSPEGVTKHKTGLYGQSPIEIFVGQGIESLKNPVWYDHLATYNILDSGDYPLPGTNSEQDRMKFLNQKRHYSWVGGVMGIEIGAELLQDFNNKSAMSLDGLLSPVSLYPTQANRTYSVSTYVGGSGVPVGSGNTNTTCPYCYNRKVITIPYVNYHSSAYSITKTEDIQIPCPVCSRAKIAIEKNDKNPDQEIGTPDINLYSLNPIVVSQGEFRNPYASGSDRCRHSIGVVSRGEYNIVDESFYINSNINTYNEGNNPDFSKFDTKVKQVDGVNVLLNHRFMALRGPLMIHGWGYDTEGYPVPNLLDMPYSIDDKNRPLRFVINDNIESKNFAYNNLDLPGKYLPDINTPSGAPLGDIITTRYKWIGTGDGKDNGNGRWVKKNKPSKKFYLNWAERQDLWPVGPVDIRWDHSRKVWSASGGCKEEILPPFIISNKNDASTLTEFLNNKSENKCPYKMIYITLEQDMKKEDNFESTLPARGFIDDIEYSKEPLQNNYRRLVYIIDTAGYTAPRGTKLLCRYNRDNGFYEPITKPILTALGTISGTTAKIQMSYTQARRAGVVPEYVYSFDNPLGLRTANNSKGLFNYINGKWTLISTG